MLSVRVDLCTLAMAFEWKEEKRRRNIKERGVDFLDAALIFESPIIEAIDERKDYGEVRMRALGHVGDDYFVVVYTWREGNRRIISAWKVNEDGRKRYQEILGR